MPTLEKDKKPYHHGDLRNTLIRVGTEMLAEESADSLSLRKLAKRAGVSHNAPYQHFADKEALLAAIAQEGFVLLSARMDEVDASQQSAHAITRLVALGQCYVQFARENPGHFQIMFGPLPQDNYPELLRESMGAFGKLQRVVQEGQVRGELHEGDPATITFAVWTCIHGVSAVLNAEKIPPMLDESITPQLLVEGVVRQLSTGLRKQP